MIKPAASRWCTVGAEAHARSANRVLRRNRASGVTAICLCAGLLAGCAGTQAPLAPAAPPVQAAPAFDPLGAAVQTVDADRFVMVFNESGGHPTAEQLQAGYLDGAGRGVQIFTEGRIRDAANLAARVNARSEEYRRAIDTCLPLVKQSNAELRAIYLALASLFPNHRLPEVHAVFGAFNSGGTAQSDAQVIGIEVICKISPDADAVRRNLRMLYSHETVHALQPETLADDLVADPLLVQSLREGFADFISHMSTGAQPYPERDEWARLREAEIWADFQTDRARLKTLVTTEDDISSMSDETRAVLSRWHMNYTKAPEGWPYELGYWVGEQICAAYFEQADDKRQAIIDLLEMKDPETILEKSGYGPT